VKLGNMAIGYQPVSHKSVVIKDNYIMGGLEGLSVYRWDTARVTDLKTLPSQRGTFIMDP